MLAGHLSRSFDAELIEIRPRDPWPEDYENMVAWATRWRDSDALLPLEPTPDLSRQTTLFLGFPICGMALPAPMRSSSPAPILPARVWRATWPNAAGGAPDSCDSPEALLRHHFAGRMVLVVDDNPINRDVVVELLEDLLLSVDVAGDGEDALDVLAQTPYDLVLMDVQMPVMDGLEATRRLRCQPALAGLPVIAMTANAFEEDRRACLAAGMNDYLAKPVQPEALFARVLHWLQWRAAETTPGRASA